MKNSLLIILLSFFFSTSCKKENSDSQSSGGTSQTIIPLAQGNIWNYRRISFPQQDTSFFSIWISGDTIVGSENWFKQYSGQDSSNYIFTKNKQDGFHYYHQNVGTDDLVYKYPAVVGDNYVASYYIDSITVQNIDTNITVPAGQFSCYEYHINEMGFYIYLSYFSPGTGKIKTISYTNGTVSNVSELISYHLE